MGMRPLEEVVPPGRGAAGKAGQQIAINPALLRLRGPPFLQGAHWDSRHQGSRWRTFSSCAPLEKIRHRPSSRPCQLFLELGIVFPENCNFLNQFVMMEYGFESSFYWHSH